MQGLTHRRLRLGALAIAAGALALAACASPPPAELESARAAYDEASSDPMVTSQAPVALYEAKKSLDRAERAWEREDRVEALHRADLAQTRVQIARVTAQGEQARARSRELAKEREQVLLEARTAEVGSARAVAERESGRAERASERAERESERARELARTLEELQAQETDRGMVLTLGDVLFDFGEATLRPGAEATLDRVARFLRENSDRQLLIEGHTDSVGSETYNQGLSQRRADTVARHLEERGVDGSRVVARGYGEALPMVSNDTDAGRQQNRRVEIVILDSGESAQQAARRRAEDLPAVGAGPSSSQER